MSGWFETTPLHEQLMRAAKNIELALARGNTGYLAGWEHNVIRQAAQGIEAGTAETLKDGSVHESPVPKGMRP